ncbi:hypothetical protein LOAG_05753 [Loa loa]|uniref:Uncharacterized protein n=1 Tax=Loa loa TaxID=7209 RepID=A0A1S0TZC3_LOALO|nr:hypothetical protein LOAG_05753 [Loa loa]EFO22731.1 hypothetical protein LOAG_05753 [Loa loa]
MELLSDEYCYYEKLKCHENNDRMECSISDQNNQFYSEIIYGRKKEILLKEENTLFGIRITMIIAIMNLSLGEITQDKHETIDNDHIKIDLIIPGTKNSMEFEISDECFQDINYQPTISSGQITSPDTDTSSHYTCMDD